MNATRMARVFAAANRPSTLRRLQAGRAGSVLADQRISSEARHLDAGPMGKYGDTSC